MLRYIWTDSDSDSLELIDTETQRPIASIIRSSKNEWHWLRKTTVARHGVAPAEGASKSLLEAKMAVVMGLRY